MSADELEGPAGALPREGQAAIAARLNSEGVTAMRARDYPTASEKFREAVARVPDASYFFNLCASWFQEGRFREAMTACKAVGNSEPTPALTAKTDKLFAKIRAEVEAQHIQLDP